MEKLNYVLSWEVHCISRNDQGVWSQTIGQLSTDVLNCSQLQCQHNSIVFSDVYFLGILSLRNPYFLIGVLLVWRSQWISTSVSVYRLPLLVSVFSYPPSSTSSEQSILLSAINKMHSPHSFVSYRFCLENPRQSLKRLEAHSSPSSTALGSPTLTLAWLSLTIICALCLSASWRTSPAHSGSSILRGLMIKVISPELGLCFV